MINYLYSCTAGSTNKGMKIHISSESFPSHRLFSELGKSELRVLFLAECSPEAKRYSHFLQHIQQNATQDTYALLHSCGNNYEHQKNISVLFCYSAALSRYLPDMPDMPAYHPPTLTTHDCLESEVNWQLASSFLKATQSKQTIGPHGSSVQFWDNDETAKNFEYKNRNDGRKIRNANTETIQADRIPVLVQCVSTVAKLWYLSEVGKNPYQLVFQRRFSSALPHTTCRTFSHSPDHTAAIHTAITILAGMVSVRS